MKRFIIIFAILVVSTLCISAQNVETAQEAVNNMKVGWNLGNTLESNSGDTTNMYIEWATKPIPTYKYETAWGQPVTTRELIHMFKAAGFNAIRVPVTWYPHMELETGMMMGSDGYQHPCWYKSQWKKDAKVDSAWMARVREVVDYVIDEGMYCILNVHHDTGAHNAAWVMADEDWYGQGKERFENLWTQIATEFRDYDQHLLFEGYNEMVDPYYSWCWASFATEGQYDATVATSAYNAVNSYAQSFVNAVRATGGNNAQRNLICNTYAGCCGDGTWSTHLTDPLTNMKKPTDTAQDHIILEVHCYPTVTDITSTKSSINTVLSRLKSNLQTQAPVIIGEWGYADGTDTTAYKQNILTFAKYFIQQTKAANMGTFYWMGLSDGNDRSLPQWSRKDIAEAILQGYYGDGYTMEKGIPVAFDATVYAMQRMKDNARGSSYMVNNATMDGTAVSKDKTCLDSLLTVLNINVCDLPAKIDRIYVYSNNKVNIVGNVKYDGTKKTTSAMTKNSDYSYTGKSDVICLEGDSNNCTAYLLPVYLLKGVKVTVHTVDGNYYSQDFSSAIASGTKKTLDFTTTTPSQLWMSTIPGQTYFSMLSTPGAHDAATSSISSSLSKCQAYSLQELLEKGVRCFDIRPGYKYSSTITASNLYIYHSSENTNVLYTDAMKTFVDFLKANPSEAITITMVKENSSGTDYSDAMYNVINSCHSSYSSYMKLLNSASYTLDDFRGKICYINRNGGTVTNAVQITNWPDDGDVTDYTAKIGSVCYANIQDKYNTNGTNKISEVETMLGYSSTNTDKARCHFNFCSAAWTLFGKTPAGNASAINQPIAAYLNDGNIPGPAGYVYGDFMGDSSHGGDALLKSVIDQNYRYVFKGREYVMGDINGDNAVTESDIKAVIDIICGGTANGKADVNGDGNVDVMDVNGIIRIISEQK